MTDFCPKMPLAWHHSTHFRSHPVHKLTDIFYRLHIEKNCICLVTHTFHVSKWEGRLRVCGYYQLFNIKKCLLLHTEIMFILHWTTHIAMFLNLVRRGQVGRSLPELLTEPAGNFSSRDRGFDR